jgi:hypothetical protein
MGGEDSIGASFHVRCPCMPPLSSMTLGVSS